MLNNQNMEPVNIFDIPITPITRKSGAWQFIEYAKKERGGYFAATPNAEILLEAQKNDALTAMLESCVLSFADSVSLLWAAEYNRKKWSKLQAVGELLLLPIRKKYWGALPETVSGSDIFEDICALAAEEDLKIFLLGGLDGVANETKSVLEQTYPKIQIVGTSEGSPQDDSIIEVIKTAGADIVFVAYGCPTQELWLAQNLEATGARIGMGIGGTFDFMAGKIPRAPQWMRKLGLEWLYRLVRQPSRFKRIWNAVVVFPWKVICA